MRRDIKAYKFKKGDMVRYVTGDEVESNSLGIVLGQKGMKVDVKWVSWPYHRSSLSTASKVSAYYLRRVEK